MAKKEFILDGSSFNTLTEAASVFTRALGLPVPWTGNLDTFDDLLSRCSGNSDAKTVIVWKNSECSRRKLNHEETARWFEQRLITCHTSTLPMFEQRLAAAQEGKGQTVFDWLVDILRQHNHIDLRLE